MKDQTGDRALLCESCGYPLAGLDVTEDSSAACPECGTPARESLPARRTGSPWQRAASAGAWWETHKGTLRRPGERFRTMRVEPRSGSRLLATTLPIAGLLLIAPWTGTLIGDPIRSARGSGPWAVAGAYMLVVPLQACVVALGLLALTWVEYKGIRFFARRRGWRLLPDAAWQICAHASAGWIVGALVPLLAMAVLWAAPGGRPSLLDRLLSRGGGIGFSSFTTGDAVLLTVVGAAYVAGMFAFELLVYAGVRRCRFANAA